MLELVKGFELQFVSDLEQFYAFKHDRGLGEVRPRSLFYCSLLAFPLSCLFYMAGVKILPGDGHSSAYQWGRLKCQMSRAHSTYLYGLRVARLIAYRTRHVHPSTSDDRVKRPDESTSC